MCEGTVRRKIAQRLLGATTFLFLLPAILPAQEGTVGSSLVDPGEEGKRQAMAGTAKSRAPEDLTGYWVALVTEDWLYRMVTPAKGDYESVPLTAEGIKLANTWDPAKDEASGNQCKAYGAAAIMRVPGRLHITWENDTTMQIDTDAGMQTRLFHFDEQASPAASPQWQGYSTATWQRFGGGRGVPLRGGYMKVETTHMRPGYLRKNGVPYSGNAALTEYFTRVSEPSGESYLIVTSVLSDQLYMNGAFTVSTHFKKEPDASGWRPTPCKAR
jgi:hypothetical protein